jgi:hypothetical protein
VVTMAGTPSVPHHKGRTPYFLLPTSYFLLPTSYFLQEASVGPGRLSEAVFGMLSGAMADAVVDSV